MYDLVSNYRLIHHSNSLDVAYFVYQILSLRGLRFDFGWLSGHYLFWGERSLSLTYDGTAGYSSALSFLSLVNLFRLNELMMNMVYIFTSQTNKNLKRHYYM